MTSLLASDQSISAAGKPRFASGLRDWADFSNTPTGTYSDSSGYTWKYVTFTGAGTLTITRAGVIEILAVAGGSGCPATPPWGRGGEIVDGLRTITTGPHTVTIGAGGPATAGSEGGETRIGTLFGFTASATGRGGVCSRSTARPASLSLTYSSSITGTDTYYGLCNDSFVNDGAGGTVPRANRGDGGGQGASTAGTGSTGIAVVRVRA